MSDMEKEVMKKLVEVYPQMTGEERGHLLGMLEERAANKEEIQALKKRVQELEKQAERPGVNRARKGNSMVERVHSFKITKESMKQSVLSSVTLQVVPESTAQWLSGNGFETAMISGTDIGIVFFWSRRRSGGKCSAKSWQENTASASLS